MQAQYRNYPPQPNQRSPLAVRRGPGPMLTAPAAPNPQQMQAQHAMEQQKRELAKRQARKPTDKNMPDGLEDIVIGDGVQRYKSLREVERRLDAVMMRKRLDITDSVNRNLRRYRTLRIWVSNTAENQPWQQTNMEPESFDFTTDSQATFRVKIEGRLLDDEDELAEEDPGAGADEVEKEGDAMETDGGDAGKAKPTPRIPERRKLSHFFKQITIDFDRSKSLQPDGYTQIEWKKPDPRSNQPNTSDQANFDCLEFERKSDENINVTIKLYRDEQPERFQLSPALARLLDTEEDDRAGVVMGIWGYIQEMNLQEDEESRKIRCDENLRAVFNQENIYFPYIPDMIIKHLSPLPPIVLKYTIRVDSPYINPPQETETNGITPPGSSQGEPTQPSAPTIYDIQVPTADPFRTALTSLTHFSPINTGPDRHAVTHQTLTELARLDDTLALAVKAITQSRAKHAFFSSLANDPAKFINRWVSSQRRDLQVILGESRGGVGPVGGVGYGWDEGGNEEWRWGGKEGVWGSKAAVEAAGLYLGRMRPAAQV